MCLLRFHVLQTQSCANSILDIIDCLGHTDIHAHDADRHLSVFYFWRLNLSNFEYYCGVWRLHVVEAD
jgi:hypothetical protein